MEDIRSIQSYILESLKGDFDENNVPAILRSASSENIPVDILTTLHRNFGRNMDEVMGEFYILPVNTGKKTILFFSSLITLTEDMDPAFADGVEKAIMGLNFYIECGSFVLNRQRTLLGLRLVTPLPADAPKETLLESANMNVALALQIGERYADSLLMLSDGRETLEHFMELLPKE